MNLRPDEEEEIQEKLSGDIIDKIQSIDETLGGDCVI